jgi:hypothetical protein
MEGDGGGGDWTRTFFVIFFGVSAFPRLEVLGSGSICEKATCELGGLSGRLVEMLAGDFLLKGFDEEKLEAILVLVVGHHSQEIVVIQEFSLTHDYCMSCCRLPLRKFGRRRYQNWPVRLGFSSNLSRDEESLFKPQHKPRSSNILKVSAYLIRYFGIQC